MFENFSTNALQIIDDALQIARNLNAKFVGSEHLLLAMYKKPDTICHFLLNEKDILYEDLINVIDNLIILRKSEIEDFTYTKKFQEIILYAEQLAKDLNSKYVYDEHIFYVMLKEYDSVACVVLEKLNLDIEDLMTDIEEIFNFFNNDDNDINNEELERYPFLTNLSTATKVHPFIKRNNYIEKINYILSKKQKNNPLLIGNAGVGKTAIVEGLSEILTDQTIFQLDLGSIVSGTKYRGELEEKITKAMEYIKRKKAIVFIDEIHNIVGAGSNDGSLDIANILKPYLSRSDIKLIGSTTLDEYYRFIEKDKALMRRFQNVYIDEPTPLETLEIIKGIKSSYESYHNVKFSNQHLISIIDKCNLYLVNRTFPDKAIDILDEVGARKKFSNKKTEDIIDEVLYDTISLKPLPLNKIRNATLEYPEIKRQYIKFMTKEKYHFNMNNMGVIEVEKNFFVTPLLKDLYKIFGFKDEMFLEIDFNNYQDATTINNLIGSSKGYVGYEQGGILSEHIIKYPMSVIYIKNIESAHISVQNYLKAILEKPQLVDNKSRTINLSNTLFLLEKRTKEEKVTGFIPSNKKVKENIYLKSKTKKSIKKDINKLLVKEKINICNVEKIEEEDFENLIIEALLQGPGHYNYNFNTKKIERLNN